jgi:hypothetical protein
VDGSAAPGLLAAGAVAAGAAVCWLSPFEQAAANRTAAALNHAAPERLAGLLRIVIGPPWMDRVIRIDRVVLDQGGT